MLHAVTSPVHMDGRQAEALLRAYRGGQLREEIETALARTFWQELRRWMTALADAARTGMRERSLPQRVYFRDLTRSVPEAVRALETPFWENALPFGRCPDVVEMDVATVHDVLDATRQCGDTSYLLLRALAHQVATMFATPSVLDRSLAEIFAGGRPRLPPCARDNTPAGSGRFQEVLCTRFRSFIWHAAIPSAASPS
jgi:hypothetical protein